MRILKPPRKSRGNTQSDQTESRPSSRSHSETSTLSTNKCTSDVSMAGGSDVTQTFEQATAEFAPDAGVKTRRSGRHGDKSQYAEKKPSKAKKPVSIIHKSIDLLARREHSVYELKQKLKQRQYSDTEIDEAIERLLADDLVSDERFTEAYVRHRAMRGFGPSKIALELKTKGVDAVLLEEYVDASSAVWLERARESYTKKFGHTAPSDYAEWTKRARFLQGRGFTSSIIQNVCPSIEFD